MPLLSREWIQRVSARFVPFSVVVAMLFPILFVRTGPLGPRVYVAWVVVALMLCSLSAFKEGLGFVLFCRRILSLIEWIKSVTTSTVRPCTVRKYALNGRREQERRCPICTVRGIV